MTCDLSIWFFAIVEQLNVITMDIIQISTV